MAKVNLQEMFVVRMQRLIHELEDIDRVTPLWDDIPEWWMVMIKVTITARETVEKFKTDKS